MTLFHDIPKSQGVINALKRAKQMVEFEWTPVKLLPAGNYFGELNGDTRWGYVNMLPWRPQKGLIYSSARKSEGFIGYNISFETFVTALANPNSVLYTRSEAEENRDMKSYYGVVCSLFASYVFDLPFRRPCARWPSAPGITQVDTTELEALELCDIVLNPNLHIMVITDIQRDVNGKVHYVSISESTTPKCIETTYTPEQLRKCYLENNYKVFRNAKVHEVKYTPSPYVRVPGDPEMICPAVNSALLPDRGNKANYELGDSVELTVFDSKWAEVVISGAETYVLPVQDGKVSFLPKKAGFYTAYCGRSGEQSVPVEFGVASIGLNLDKNVCTEGEKISVSFTPAAGEDEFLGWIVNSMGDNYRQGKYFNEEQKTKKQFLLDTAEKEPVLDTLLPGEYYIFVLAKNKYGVYRSERVKFCVEKAEG